MDDRGHMREDLDRLDAVECSEYCAHVLLQRGEDRRRFPKDIDALRGGDREERRDSAGTAAGKTEEAP